MVLPWGCISTFYFYLFVYFSFCHIVFSHLGWLNHIVVFVFNFWPCHATCGILVPWPGIEPAPPALEARGHNHWTAREVPMVFQPFRSQVMWSVCHKCPRHPCGTAPGAPACRCPCVADIPAQMSRRSEVGPVCSLLCPQRLVWASYAGCWRKAHAIW